MIVACHWNMLSPVGPALHEEGGSRPRSINSYSVQHPDAGECTHREKDVSNVIQTTGSTAQPNPPHPALRRYIPQRGLYGEKRVRTLLMRLRAIGRCLED